VDAALCEAKTVPPAPTATQSPAAAQLTPWRSALPALGRACQVVPPSTERVTVPVVPTATQPPKPVQLTPKSVGAAGSGGVPASCASHPPAGRAVATAPSSPT